MFIIEPHIKALIFDCDGTLIDSLDSHYLAWQAAYKEEGKEFWSREEHRTRVGGSSSENIVALINEVLGYEVDPPHMAVQKEALFLRKFAKEARPIAKVLEIAKQYHSKLPLVVASNGHREIVHCMLEANEIKYLFDHVITIEDVEHPKPAPDIFLAAAKLCDVAAKNCLVFEDSHTGFEAAKRANMAYVDIRDL